MPRPLLAAALLLVPPAAFAQSPPAGSAAPHACCADRTTCPMNGECGGHGGVVTEHGRVRCETVLDARGLSLFLTDADGRPVPARGVRGAAVLRVAGNPKSYRYDLFPAAGEDAPPNLLALPLDLSKVAGREVSAAVRLAGVPGAGPDGLVVRRAVTIADPAAGRFTAGTPVRAADADAAAVARQKICPVMDEPLGSMGVPWRVPVTGPAGDATVFVCCRGCIKRVVADPAKYAALVPPPPPARATDADAAAIAAQRTCPVMDEPLGSMGVPWKVPVAGGAVFVCCKGCIKRIIADPVKYLAATGSDSSTRR